VVCTTNFHVNVKFHGKSVILSDQVLFGMVVGRQEQGGEHEGTKRGRFDIRVHPDPMMRSWRTAPPSAASRSRMIEVLSDEM